MWQIVLVNGTARNAIVGMLAANKTGEGTFPVVVVKVNGIECRALIDSGAGSLYASAKLIERLNVKAVESKVKHVNEYKHGQDGVLSSNCWGGEWKLSNGSSVEQSPQG